MFKVIRSNRLLIETRHIYDMYSQETPENIISLPNHCSPSGKWSHWI